MESGDCQRGTGRILASTGLYNVVREKRLIMWPAVVGLLSLALVVFFVGMISARSSSARNARTGTSAVSTHSSEKSEPKRGNNNENPDAMAMATGTRTNNPDSQSGPYSGS